MTAVTLDRPECRRCAGSECTACHFERHTSCGQTVPCTCSHRETFLDRYPCPCMCGYASSGQSGGAS